MASYDSLKPGPNEVLTIPESESPTILRAYRGGLMIFSGDTFDAEDAWPLMSGETMLMPPNQEWKVSRMQGDTAQLRRIDTVVPMGGGASPTKTAPAKFSDTGWSLAPGQYEGQIVLTIINRPNNGGSIVTALAYSLDGGQTPVLLTGSGSGPRTLMMPELGVEYTFVIRAENEIGEGEWSDPKSEVSQDQNPAPAPTAPTLTGGGLAYIDGDLIITDPDSLGLPDPVVIRNLTRGTVDVAGEVVNGRIPKARSGNYKSKWSATNGVPPNAELEATLTVITVPDQFSPASWSVSQGQNPGEIILNIQSLPHSGGSIITALAVSVDGGALEVISGLGVGPRVLEMEEAGRTYGFALLAQNSQGWGNPSESKPATSRPEPVVAPTFSRDGNGISVQNAGTFENYSFSRTGTEITAVKELV